MAEKEISSLFRGSSPWSRGEGRRGGLLSAALSAISAPLCGEVLASPAVLISCCRITQHGKLFFTPPKWSRTNRLEVRSKGSRSLSLTSNRLGIASAFFSRRVVRPGEARLEMIPKARTRVRPTSKQAVRKAHSSTTFCSGRFSTTSFTTGAHPLSSMRPGIE